MGVSVARPPEIAPRAVLAVFLKRLSAVPGVVAACEMIPPAVSCRPSLSGFPRPNGSLVGQLGEQERRTEPLG